MNASAYGALGAASLIIINIFGPFENAPQQGASSQMLGIELGIYGLTGNNSVTTTLVVRHPPRDAYNPLPSELQVVIRANEGEDKSFFERITVGSHPTGRGRTNTHLSPVDCDSSVITSPSENRLLALREQPIDPIQGDVLKTWTGTVTEMTPDNGYIRGVRLTCPIRQIGFFTDSRNTESVVIPAISVVGLSQPPQAKVEVTRGLNDVIVSSSRAPDTTGLENFEWNFTKPTYSEAMVVTISNPALQQASDKSMFLWGLFSGIAGAFFVAALQEIIGNSRSKKKP